jgi:hypothetical protein
MELIKTEECLHSKFEDGKVTFGIYISSECGDADIDAAIETWAAWEEDVFLSFRFSIAECVDDMIEFLRHFRVEPTTVSESHRDAFLSLRAELVATIEKIDALKYAP